MQSNEPTIKLWHFFYDSHLDVLVSTKRNSVSFITIGRECVAKYGISFKVSARNAIAASAEIRNPVARRHFTRHCQCTNRSSGHE